MKPFFGFFRLLAISGRRYQRQGLEVWAVLDKFIDQSLADGEPKTTIRDQNVQDRATNAASTDLLAPVTSM